MGDRICRVCGEPWDAYGLNTGDVLWWEKELFDKGLGCPSCEGEGNEEWLEPEPQVLWTCAGCGVSCVISNEHDWLMHRNLQNMDWLKDNAIGDLLMLQGGERVHYYAGHGPFAYPYLPDAYPSRNPRIIDGENYCHGCSTKCSECGEPIFTRSELEVGDTYPPGAAFSDPRSFRSVLCLQCFDAVPTCCYCGEYDEDLDEDGYCELCANERK